MIHLRTILIGAVLGLLLSSPAYSWGVVGISGGGGSVSGETTIYGTTADGWVKHAPGSMDWATVRNAETGGSVDTDDQVYTVATQAMKLIGYYTICRGFLYFDLSGLSGKTIDSVEVHLYSSAQQALTTKDEVSIQAGTQADTLTTADFDSFSGDEWGHSSSWTASQENVITLNATGISAVSAAQGGTLKACIRNYTYDYSNSAPGDAYNSGIYFQDSSTEGYRPHMVVTWH